MENSAHQISLFIRAEPRAFPEVQEVAAFVYDVNLLYELRVLELIDPEAVSPSNATGWILSRTGRPIPPATKLLLSRLRYGSPIDVVLQLRDAMTTFDFVVATGALWVLVQTLEKIYNLPANHRLIESQRRLADAQAAELARADREAEEPVEIERILIPNGQRMASAPSHEEVDAARDNAYTVSRRRDRPSVINPIPAAESRLRRARIRVTEIDLDIPNGLSGADRGQ